MGIAIQLPEKNHDVRAELGVLLRASIVSNFSQEFLHMRQLDLHGLAGYCFKDLLFTGTPHPSIKVELRNRGPPGTQVDHVVLMVTITETASTLAEEPLEILLNGLPILFNSIDDLLKFG